MIKKLVFISVIILIVFGFTNKKPTCYEHCHENLFCICLPFSMDSTRELNPESAFQYQDTAKQIYILILYESLEDLISYNGDTVLSSYFEFVQSNMKNLDSYNGSLAVNMDINGLDALQSNITGNLNDKPLYYILTVVKSKTHFYQILAWTEQKNVKKNKLVMEKMISSFKGF